MTNKCTIALLGMLLPVSCLAQATTEKKDIRLYEHHSSGMNDGMAFGVGANGSQSGYDFVNHDYYNSFNPSTFGAWGAAEVANIDMVEHAGPFGGGSATTPFGFTSATSTIWGGDIKGNNLTVYAPAPASFNYDSATDVAYIKEAFSTSASKTIAAVVANKVYLGKIRGTEMYVAIKVTEARNAPAGTIPGSSVVDVYFDFDYKYGTFSPTGIDDVYKNAMTLNVTPNPSKGQFTIMDFPKNLNKNNAKISIVDMMGKVVYEEQVSTGSVNHQLQPGNYVVLLSDGSNNYRSRIVVAE